jgi:hypothetical protein
MRENTIKENIEPEEELEMPFCSSPEDSENARNDKEDDPCRI